MAQNNYTDRKFFTEDDLRLLHEYGDKDPTLVFEADTIVAKLSEGVWAKTKEWSSLVVVNGFRAECRRAVKKQAGRTAKQADGRSYMRRVFRPYSWAKLYRPSEKLYGIFFTLGVDGRSQSLMWKLDCKRTGKNALAPQLVLRFDEYVYRNVLIARCTVPIEGLKQYDWKKLVTETHQFIIDNLLHYEAALAYTWQGSKPEAIKARK
jgi:hypothetical protein